MILKDDAYQEEKEWRIVSRTGVKITDERVAFRSGKSFLIPYFRFPLAGEGTPLNLEQVIVGPCPHPELSKDSVQALIFKYNAYGLERDEDWYYFKKVVISNIPYRAW